ncbi:chaperone EMC4 [Sporobolomyces salmoneus]|uniref:chaperone EMC4 n=1 Tax=Sporobolomyces salmoneus TaxID=183962 RepID=UPI00316F33C1
MAPLASTSKWTLDYTSAPRSEMTVQDPPGFSPSESSKTANKAESKNSKSSGVNLDALRSQKAWEVALAPAKSVPMQAFMMYMTGGGIQVFSVMSVWFLLKQAVGGMMSVENVFAPYTAASRSKATLSTTAASDSHEEPPPSFIQQKLVYLLCQLGLLAVGAWKLNSMGLLPTHESDWIAFREYPEWKRLPIDTSHVRHLMGKVHYS